MHHLVRVSAIGADRVKNSNYAVKNTCAKREAPYLPGKDPLGARFQLLKILKCQITIWHSTRQASVLHTVTMLCPYRSIAYILKLSHHAFSILETEYDAALYE